MDYANRISWTSELEPSGSDADKAWSNLGSRLLEGSVCCAVLIHSEKRQPYVMRDQK